MKYLEVQLELNLKLNTVCDPRFPVLLPLLTLFPLPERLSFSLFLPQSLSPILLSRFSWNVSSSMETPQVPCSIFCHAGYSSSVVSASCEALFTFAEIFECFHTLPPILFSCLSLAEPGIV